MLIVTCRDVDAAVAAELIAGQFPDLADRPLKLAAQGWDNLVFRLGDDLNVRMPRRESAAALVVNEFRWGARLIEGLELPIRVVVPALLGQPGHGYPWHWTIGPWTEGETIYVSPPRDDIKAASVLGTCLARLHRPAPQDAPTNPYRGVPLAARVEAMRDGLGSGIFDAHQRAVLTDLWDEALRIPQHEQDPVWLHGDVHPLNLLVRDGELCALIDLGDVCAGDPASDLAVGWMLFEGDARRVFRDAACQIIGGIDGSPKLDDQLWRRAWGWALALGVAFTNGDSKIKEIGLRTLRRAAAE